MISSLLGMWICGVFAGIMGSVTYGQWLDRREARRREEAPDLAPRPADEFRYEGKCMFCGSQVEYRLRDLNPTGTYAQCSDCRQWRVYHTARRVQS